MSIEIDQTTDNTTREYITVTEAAKRMGVSRVTMSQAANRGMYARHVINKRELLVWQDGGLVRT